MLENLRMNKSRKIIIVGMANFKFQSPLKPLKVSHSSFKPNLFGFGIIEAMVAMVIIAIVAIGTTQLAIAARRAEYDAQLRRVAMMLLLDMQDRMKSNRSESTNNNGAVYVTSIPIGGRSIPTKTCIGVGLVSCNPQEMALYDHWDWSRFIVALLPPPATGPIATIVNNSVETSYQPTTFTITINWTGSAGSSQTASVSFPTPLYG
jgi:Tfp pilus assembly protein PilV